MSRINPETRDDRRPCDEISELRRCRVQALMLEQGSYNQRLRNLAPTTWETAVPLLRENAAQRRR